MDKSTSTKTGCFALLVISIFAVPFSLAQANEAALQRGKTAAAVCVACHQADGNGLQMQSGTPWPRLAGLDSGYLARQLHAFKTGKRQNAEMKPFAAMLTDEQINDVAAYYASLPAKPSASLEASPEVLAAGEKLATHGDWNRYIVPCISCHGPGNQGVGSEFPDIAGQQPGYIANQLHAWKQGTRKGDPMDLMLNIAQRMNDDDILAVSAWLASQPPASQTVPGESD